MSKTNKVVRLLWRLLMEPETALVGIPRGHTGLRRIKKWRRGRKRLLRLDAQVREDVARAHRAFYEMTGALKVPE